MMIIKMINSLFANFCILVTFLFLSGMLSKKYAVIGRSTTRASSVGIGLLFGLFGMILMEYSFPVGPGTFANIRHLTIVIVSAYIGWLPAIICAAVLALSRVLIYGLMYSSVTASVSLLLIGLCCSGISALRWSRMRKVMIGNLISMGICFATLVANLGDLKIIMEFFPLQLGVTLAAGLAVYYVAEYIQRSNDLYAQLEVRAATDYLTNLNNLHQFHRHLDTEMARAERHGESLSLLVIDIDHFKIINDTYGHPAGDAVLKQLARRLCNHSRSYDIVSRNGGEEFTILLPDCPLHQAQKAGERIRVAVENDRFLLPSGNKIHLTVSIGAASYPENIQDADGDLLSQYADKALYAAKNSGRNKVCAADPYGVG
ncbi:diguanylate cyclase [Paenibacillus sophorae]|uniref:Diguanylate cyclase n=1 Tax=Paenibacillus sophorae TaxID=1333845 RepID=A0A1H8II19_9BACL|nr:diguanylate cyclase [Paenibacillus sophorae]QWU15955.1 diguanylate cyclase [Paenibacillus sophorae]SEN67507.1 diguanylate cyclase [Paenibacillus sophorae]